MLKTVTFLKNSLFLLFSFAFGLNLASWGLLYYRIPESNFPFIVKYTLGSLSDFWGTRLELFLVPFLGLIILVANAILGFVLGQQEKFFSILLAGFTVFLQIMVVLYALTTVFVNTY